MTCLANLGTKDGVILYAGINDSEEDRLKDKNKHLKSFQVQFPKHTGNTQSKEGNAPQGKISFLSKTALFTPPANANAKKEGYQRIVRLSPVQRTASNTLNKRIGAVASSLAGDENEIVIFSATSNKPENPKDVIQRILLHKNQETNDLDILDEGEGRFQVAYCLDNDVSVQKIRYDFGKRRSLGKGDADRKKLYTVPFPDLSQKKGRSKIRCIRWLSPSHILLLANKPNRTGAELLVLRLYEEGPGSIIFRKAFPRHVQAAVDMDVALLDADADGAYQIIVAVAAIDVSLTILTIDYQGKSRNELSKFSSFATYYNVSLRLNYVWGIFLQVQVHELQMTKVVFSPFLKPESSSGKKAGPQYLRLATTSLGNSIDVETFELYPLSKKPQSRHLLQSATSKAWADRAKYTLIAMIVLAIALMLQGFIDPEGSLTKGIIPEGLQNAANRMQPPGAVANGDRDAANLDGANSPAVKATHRLRDLLHLHRNTHSDSAPVAEQKALVVHHDRETDGTLSTEVHDGEYDVVKKHTEAKRWEDLSKHEQKRWKDKLVSAGMWTIEEGETILKGVFFSEAGALVGRVAAGVIG